MALTQLEQYGATYEMDSDHLASVQTGLNTLRNYDGWADLKVPEKIWDYVSQADRDDILTNLQAFCDKRDSAFWAASGATKEEWFAFIYICWLWGRWWLESKSKETDVTVLEAMIETDLTVPVDHVTNDFAKVRFFAPWSSLSTQYCVTFYPDGSYELEVSAYINSYSKGFEYDSAYEDSYHIFYDYSDSQKVYSAPCEYGVLAVWTSYFASIPDGLYLSDLSPFYSANISLSEYGQADGSVELWAEKKQGDSIQLVQYLDNEPVNLMAGVVSKVRKDLQNNRYRLEFSDLVSAKSNGEVEYSAGSPLTILQTIIEGYGGTFNTDITTDAVFYSSGESVYWYDLCRSICLALNAQLVYNADGSYTLSRSPSIHSMSSFFDGEETQETERYKNSITATIDEEFTTDVDAGDDPTVETESVMGKTVTIIRKGEQIQSIKIKDNATDVERVESYTYNASGYLTEKSVSEESSTLKQTRTEEFSNITDDNNYDFDVTESNEEYVLQCDFFGAGQTCALAWVETNRVEISGEVHLGSISRVEKVTKEILSRADATWTLINQEKREYTVFQDNDGPIKERIICEIYNWVRYLADAVSMTYEYHWVKAGVESDPENPILSLELNPPVYQNSYHLSSTAKDQNAIDTLGEIVDSVQLLGISDEETLYQAALSELIRRSRVRIYELEGVLNPDILVGDLLSLESLNWVIEEVNHSINSGRLRTRVTASQVSTVVRLQTSLGLDPANYDLAVIKQIKKQGSLVHNVNRAKIVGRVDYETYQVQLPEQEEGKTVLAKAPYAVNEVLPVGAQVLLARATGRGKRWEILWRSHESPISGITGSAQVTPDDDTGYQIPTIQNFVSAEPKGVAPFETALSWDVIDPEQRVTKLEIDYGDDSETIDETVEGEAVGIGDGATVTFALAHTPKSGLVVYLDGVETSDYTADGANITFNTAPASAVVITADYVWERTWGTGIAELTKDKRSVSHTWETYGTYTVKIRAYYTDNDDVEQVTEWVSLGVMAGTAYDGYSFEQNYSADESNVDETGQYTITLSFSDFATEYNNIDDTITLPMKIGFTNIAIHQATYCNEGEPPYNPGGTTSDFHQYNAFEIRIRKDGATKVSSSKGTVSADVESKWTAEGCAVVHDTPFYTSGFPDECIERDYTGVVVECDPNCLAEINAWLNTNVANFYFKIDPNNADGNKAFNCGNGEPSLSDAVIPKADYADLYFHATSNIHDELGYIGSLSLEVNAFFVIPDFVVYPDNSLTYEDF